LASDVKVRKSRYFFVFLRLIVVAVGITWAIFWLSRDHRWNNLVRIFSEMNIGWFACALAIYSFGQAIIGLRWWLLLQTQSVHIPLWSAVKLHFLGLFYNNFMPSSVGGDLIRAWYVTRHTHKKFEAVLSVFVDRMIGLFSTLVIATVFYLLFLKGQGGVVIYGAKSQDNGGFLGSVGEHKVIVVWTVIVIAAVFLGLLLHSAGRSLLGRGLSAIRLYGSRAFVKLTNAARLYGTKPLTLIKVFALTVVMQLMTITGFWILGSNLGVDVSIRYYFVFFTLTWVLGAIPVSIGGVVVVEVLLASMFIKLAGVAVEAASALALCQRAVWMLASLPGAGIHLAGAHLPKHFFVDSEKILN